MIAFASGDIFESDCQTIVNPVNTVGVMGAGLAAEFKRRFPDMFEQYRRHCKSGALRVGTLWLYRGSAPWVLCLPTKRHWRDRSRLEDIDLGLARLAATYEAQGITSVAVPALGCGLGALPWPEVKDALRNRLGGLPLPVTAFLPSL